MKKLKKITALTRLGKDGMINIEREAKLSGPTHDKGMEILTGKESSNYLVEEKLKLLANKSRQNSAKNWRKQNDK